jgi:tetratricopeptide (TPR) repeat protein
VPRTSEHAAAAVAGLARASQRQLLKLAAAGENTSDAAEQAINRLSAFTEVNNNSAADRTAALAGAELVLTYAPKRAAEAEVWLKEALSSAGDADADWKAAAQAQLAIALTSQGGKAEESLELLRQLGADRSRLSGDLRDALARAEAESLAASGRRDEALALYRKLVAAHPDSGPLQEGYAALLLAGDDKDSLTVALAQWRIIASRSKPRTDRWWQAKYSVALAQFKLGDKAGAATLLRYVLHTPPGLAGTAWEEKFTALLEECER